MSQRRSPTETLLAALEEFGKDEPSEVMVIFTTQGGDICDMSSTDTLSVKLGMLETVAVFVRQEIAGMRERP
jgi:hypothetical protein